MKNKVIYFIHYYFILESLETFWNLIYGFLNYIFSKTLCLNFCYWNFPLDFAPLRKDWALVETGT